MSSKSAIASLCPGSNLPWAVVNAFLQQEHLEPSALIFFTPQDSSLNDIYGAALCSASSSVHSREAFSEISKALAPGSRLYIYDPLLDASKQVSLQKDLLLTGFTGSKVDNYAGVVMILAVKPEWQGAKSSLKLKKKPAVPAPAVASAPKAWGINADDNDELMDDEDLLTEDDKKPALNVADDCDVGQTGKKACKNCSCGRAELEEQGVKLTAEMLENPQSACGSCGLGDAFRCSTCPYKGLPTFEAGKKVQLSMDLMTADF